MSYDNGEVERVAALIKPLSDAIEVVNGQIPDTVQLDNPDLDGIYDGQALTINNPTLWAQMLMQMLTGPMDTKVETFDPEAKLYWAAVAEALGPDYIAKYRRIGAFMKAFIDG
ncbi:MAG: hypothetical protein HOO86_09965 [Bacteroidales bacterium]|nr:hypothetical protein [Bacteroidales bacterium]